MQMWSAAVAWLPEHIQAGIFGLDNFDFSQEKQVLNTQEGWTFPSGLPAFDMNTQRSRTNILQTNDQKISLGEHICPPGQKSFWWRTLWSQHTKDGNLQQSEIISTLAGILIRLNVHTEKRTTTCKCLAAVFLWTFSFDAQKLNQRCSLQFVSPHVTTNFMQRRSRKRIMIGSRTMWLLCRTMGMGPPTTVVHCFSLGWGPQ